MQSRGSEKRVLDAPVRDAELARQRESSPDPSPEHAHSAKPPGLGQRPVVRTLLMLLAIALPILMIVTNND